MCGVCRAPSPSHSIFVLFLHVAYLLQSTHNHVITFMFSNPTAPAVQSNKTRFNLLLHKLFQRREFDAQRKESRVRNDRIAIHSEFIDVVVL